jgi:hypothetical protein
MGRVSKIAIISLAACSAARGSIYSASILYPLVGETGIEYASPSGGVESVAAGQATGLGYGTKTTNNGDPIIWSGPAGNLVDLNPENLTTLTTATVSSTNGSQQVGYASLNNSSGNFHALLWSGSGTSAVDLNPSGFVASFANGLSAAQEVGQASKTTSGNSHAILWNGSAASAVDLNPSGYASSVAYGANDVNQVGEIEGVSTGNQSHASIWSGNASSFVDLNPTNFGVTFSLAYGVAGAEQVGYGGLAGNTSSVALLWEGSSKTAVNLNPAGSATSVAYGTNGTQQVGFVQPANGNPSATAWSGSTDSTLNLQNLLPSAGTWSSSNAYTVDSAGNIYGTAFGTYNGTADSFVVEWSPTPASGSVAVSSGQTYHFTINPGTGIFNTAAAGLTIAPGGAAIVDPAPNHANRQLLTVLGGGLTLSGTGGHWTARLDLGNNDLDLPGASLATVTSQIAQGYAFGSWNGTGGITSSAAAADTSHLTALGVILNDQAGTRLYSSTNLFDTIAPAPYDVLVKYTWDGDANLDGKVDGSDYSLIDAGYASNQPGFKGTILTGWYNGDFNYDGVIDGSDYALIDNAFNNQTGNLSPASDPAFATVQVDSAPASVPEPAIGAIFAALVFVPCRRLRGSRAAFPRHRNKAPILAN